MNTHNNSTQGIYPGNPLKGKPTNIGALPLLLYRKLFTVITIVIADNSHHQQLVLHHNVFIDAKQD